MEAWRRELYSSELYHWGIKGMKWGVRRYQNPDGTLTAAGRKRYASRMAVRTHNAVADRMNGGELKRFNAKYGHLAESNRDEYMKKYKELNKRLWDEESKNTEQVFNTPRKSAKELDRLWDTRYKGQENPSNNGNKYREKAKKQGESALKFAGAWLVSNLASSYGQKLIFNGQQEVGSLLAMGGGLASAGLGAASVVQASRAGYNYMKSKK